MLVVSLRYELETELSLTTRVNIFDMNTLPPFETFVVYGEKTRAGTRWRKWIAKFENLSCALDIENDARKKPCYSTMQATMNKKVLAQWRRQPYSQRIVLKQSLEEYFTPKKNISYETFKFRQTTQKEGESIDTFHTQFRAMTIFCDFHDNEILGQIIQGCTSSRVRRKALKANSTRSFGWSSQSTTIWKQSCYHWKYCCC